MGLCLFLFSSSFAFLVFGLAVVWSLCRSHQDPVKMTTDLNGGSIPNNMIGDQSPQTAVSTLWLERTIVYLRMHPRLMYRPHRRVLKLQLLQPLPRLQQRLVQGQLL